MITIVRRWRVLIFSVLVISFFPAVVHAAPPPPPVLHQGEWRTGEIEVNYSGVTPGAAISLYSKSWHGGGYQLHDFWFATGSEGTHITPELENGQTVWYYITQKNDQNEESGWSNVMKVTPPITAIIINWPDLLQDISNLFLGLNDSLTSAIKGMITPSEQAMDDFTDAVNGLKDAMGMSAVEGMGSDLITGFDAAQSGMSPVIVADDGVGTYTGGAGGMHLPQEPVPVPDTSITEGLEAPDPDGGTDCEFTMRVPYTVNMQGELQYMKLFTCEQMDKIKWLGLFYDLAEYTMWIISAIGFIVKFVPKFKV